MAQASIPVDLLNPGQVFACMGFLEAADVLLGGAEGKFEWTNKTKFCISAKGNRNPVEAVLEFLFRAQCKRLAPKGDSDPTPKKSQTNKQTSDALPDQVETFPTAEADYLALPLRFEQNDHVLHVSHWCDASSRNSFKLFAGQQRSDAIAEQMLDGVKKLWNERHDDLLKDPLGLTIPLGGSSFKMDARKAWTTIDAGFSPDEQGHAVEASPVVEILAAIGLEHARPDEFATRQVRYGVWQDFLPPMLARAALGAVHVGVPLRIFQFTLRLAGKNKIVTFAQEETNL